MKQSNLRQNRLRAGVKSFALAAGLAVTALAGPQVASAANAPFLSTSGIAPPPSGASNLCQTYSWACATRPQGRPASAAQMEIIKAVNLRVNRTVRPVEDRKQYGVTEHWTIPSARGGDCEDYALAKKRELVRQGIDPRRLLIATALDRRRSAHAVLIYRSDQGDLVLDNVTNRIKDWRDTGYLFLRMQDPERPTRWVNVFSGA